MLGTFPTRIEDFMAWQWPQIEPYFQGLAARPLSADNVSQWLLDWTQLSDRIDETKTRLYVASTCHTSDKAIQERQEKYLTDVIPLVLLAEQQLKEKLLNSRLAPSEFEVPLRKMRAQAELYRQANLPLLTEVAKLIPEYDQIVGAQTVEWEGVQVPLKRLDPILLETDRSRRERAWRKMAERQIADRAAIVALWNRLLAARRQIAANAGLADYRAYRWREMLRFDYTPDDTKTYVQAVEAVVVPVMGRLAETRRRQLGLDTLRPWDIGVWGTGVDPLGRPPLKPFATIQELVSKAATIFQQLDPQLGGYFEIMRQEGLLDLSNREGKAPGAYSLNYMASRQPFIFGNSVGVADDVTMLMHEAGHCFHSFESAHLPYFQQRQEEQIPAEFAEVASLGMELLTLPYLAAEKGGFYSSADHARQQADHLIGMLGVWTVMAVREAFQHWVYDNPDAASDGMQCDAKWAELIERFSPAVDWTGLEAEKAAGWRSTAHILQSPFDNIEYAVAQLGAVQVWANAMHDPKGALARYRQALALGGSATLPQLYEAAGAKFAFDAETLRSAVTMIENKLAELEAQ